MKRNLVDEIRERTELAECKIVEALEELYTETGLVPTGIIVETINASSSSDPLTIISDVTIELTTE